MEVISENDNSNINLSNIINNQNESNQKITESSNQKDYPFQLITKEQDKSEINYILDIQIMLKLFSVKFNDFYECLNI